MAEAAVAGFVVAAKSSEDHGLSGTDPNVWARANTRARNAQQDNSFCIEDGADKTAFDAEMQRQCTRQQNLKRSTTSASFGLSSQSQSHSRTHIKGTKQVSNTVCGLSTRLASSPTMPR